MLQIDSTLFIQIANFLFLLLVLNFILYRPIRRILARREEETQSLEKMISDYAARCEEHERGIQEGMIEARKEGFSVKEGLKGEGQKEERSILQEASSEAEGKIGQARQELEAKMMDVRKTLEDEVAGFSRELAEKILGRSVQ